MAGYTNLQKILNDEYDVGILRAPPEAILWAAAKLMEQSNKKKALEELRSLNELREKKGIIGAYPDYHDPLFDRNMVASELIKIAKLLAADDGVITVGDNVRGVTRRGTRNLIVVFTRPMRGGKSEITLAEPEHPEITWTYKVMSMMYADNTKYLKFLGKTSNKELTKHRETINQNIMQRSEQKQDDTRENQEALDTLKIEAGDKIRIKGPGYNWSAIVGDINYSTGKVGIVRANANQRSDLDEMLVFMLGKTRRTRQYRWIPARHVVEVILRAKDINKSEQSIQ